MAWLPLAFAVISSEASPQTDGGMFGQNLCPVIPGLGRRPRARKP
jgi:hypothetical protein